MIEQILKDVIEMKFKGFNNKVYSISFSKGTRNKVSSFHERARHLLKKIFPSEMIFEEVGLPGSFIDSKNQQLYADFLIPGKKLIVEIQGQGHYKFIAHFHKDKNNFLKIKNNDSRKKEWAELNELILIELPFNESDEQWTARIEGRHNSIEDSNE